MTVVCNMPCSFLPPQTLFFKISLELKGDQVRLQFLVKNPVILGPALMWWMYIFNLAVCKYNGNNHSVTDKRFEPANFWLFSLTTLPRWSLTWKFQLCSTTLEILLEFSCSVSKIRAVGMFKMTSLVIIAKFWSDLRMSQRCPDWQSPSFGHTPSMASDFPGNFSTCHQPDVSEGFLCQRHNMAFFTSWSQTPGLAWLSSSQLSLSYEIAARTLLSKNFLHRATDSPVTWPTTLATDVGLPATSSGTKP